MDTTVRKYQKDNLGKMFIKMEEALLGRRIFLKC